MSEKVKKCKHYGPCIIFSISGGIGKNIIATAVITSIKKKYPNHNLVIISAWPDVFLNNPNVYRVYKFGNTPYFMEDYIKDNTLVMQIDPYHNNNFIHKEKHLIEVWCETCGVKCVSKEPELYLTQAEIDFAKQKFARNKPLFVLQTNGGVPNQTGMKYSWSRDIPINQAQQVVDVMNETHYVMHIRRPDQLQLNNCEPVSASLRELFALISISDKRLFNESFGYHCAAAFKLPSTVCFVGTKPLVYSYPFHINILPKDEKTFVHSIDKYLEDAPWAGEKLYECPYDIKNIFSIPEIVEAIKKQPKNKENFVVKTSLQNQNQVGQVDIGNLKNSQAIFNQNIDQPSNNLTNLDSNPMSNSNLNQINNSFEKISNARTEGGNFIDTYFDKIYYINLERRKDRKERMEKELKKANINTVVRFPGVEITDEEFKKLDNSYYKNFRGLKQIEDKENVENIYIKASIGVRKAHLNCVKDAKEKGYKKILILEDDLIIDENSNNIFYNIIQNVGDDWQLLYLGGDYRENYVTFQLSSYALDSSIFDFIINNIEKSGIEDDFFFVEQVQKKFKTLRTIPMLMWQTKTDSDIPTHIKNKSIESGFYN